MHVRPLMADISVYARLRGMRPNLPDLLEVRPATFGSWDVVRYLPGRRPIRGAVFGRTSAYTPLGMRPNLRPATYWKLWTKAF